MPSPYNYSAMQEQLDISPLVQGLQLRRQNKLADSQVALQQQRADKIAQDEAKLVERQTMFQKWAAEGDHSVAGYQQAMLDFPENFQQLKSASDLQTAAQRTRNVQAGMRLGGFINAGLVDPAIKDLEARRDALAKAGESTEVTDAALAALKRGDVTAAKKIAGIVITGTLGDGGLDVMKSLGWDAETARNEARDNRAERADARAERRDVRDERKTDAMIGFRASSNARAERKANAPKGGGKGGKSGAYSNDSLDALLK